nr:GNAT family N-acetyltransferase [Allomuricauda sp.]
MKGVTRLNLFNSIYERRPLPEFCSSASLSGVPLVGELEKDSVLFSGHVLYSFRLVPDYYQFREPPKEYQIKKLHQFNWGYSIDLKGFETIDQYLESQFKSKTRSIIRRYVSRLEKCFPIKYQMYFGKIDKKEYERLMASLEHMIRQRFNQRKEKHMEMNRWEAIKKEAFALINSKKASLFVIFDGHFPIEISLNYHCGKNVFSSISSFDLNYSKFGLGHVEIYKQLEWCLENGHELFDMGVGGMDYKRRWCNHIYRFENWILIHNTSFWSKYLGSQEYILMRIKEYLKSKSVNEVWDRLLIRLHGLFMKDSVLSRYTYSIETIHEIPEEHELSPITEEEVQKIGIQKPLNDFLYSSNASRNSVKVYGLSNESNTYLALSANKGIRITLSNI